MTVYSALFNAVLVVATAANPEPCATWYSVADHSELHFIANFEGAPAPGEFHRFSVCMDFDPEQLRAGRLEVRVDITSADMASADVNEAIAGPEWFDFVQFPQAHFLSEEIAGDGDAMFVAHGRLTLKGMERDIDVPFSWQSEGAARYIKGELTLERSDFNIGSGEWSEDDAIGFDVTVRFEVKLETAP